MAIITFWNDGKVETSQSMTLAAVATTLAINYNYKILMINTKHNDKSLEHAFESKNTINSIFTKGKLDLDTGLSGVAKAIMSSKTSPEIITNYTKIVFKDRLEVLTGLKTTNYQEYERVLPLYQDVLQFANKSYDMIFVDLNKGLNNENIRAILDFSDLVVVNITQRLKTIEDYIELKQNEKLFQKNNTMLLIGRYDKYSKYNSKNISRYIGEKKEIATVPYSTLFFEACNEGKVADFFLRFRKIDPNDRNAIFMSEIKKTADKLIYKIQELKLKL